MPSPRLTIEVSDGGGREVSEEGGRSVMEERGR